VTKTQVFSIAAISVPAKRLASLDSRKVLTIAESIMESVRKMPILVRGGRPPLRTRRGIPPARGLPFFGRGDQNSVISGHQP